MCWCGGRCMHLLPVCMPPGRGAQAPMPTHTQPAFDIRQQRHVKVSTELVRRYRYANISYRSQGPYLALEGLPRPFPRGHVASYVEEQQQEEQDRACEAAAATVAAGDIANSQSEVQEEDEAVVGPGCTTSATATSAASPTCLALLDYHVCYSLSYQVPLMCFRATWPGVLGTRH